MIVNVLGLFSLKEWLLEGAEYIFNIAFNFLKDISSVIYNDILVRTGNADLPIPDTFLSSINFENVLEYVKKISDSVFLPFAALILAFCFTQGIYKLVSSSNNMNPITIQQIGNLLLHTTLAMIIVSNSTAIILKMFDYGAYIFIKIYDKSTLAFDGFMSHTINLHFKDYEGLFGVGHILVIFLASIIALIVCLGAFIGIALICKIRLFTIFATMVMAPLSLATLGSEEYKSVGIGYIKTILAYVLQGGIMLFMIGLFFQIGMPKDPPEIPTIVQNYFDERGVHLPADAFKTKGWIEQLENEWNNNDFVILGPGMVVPVPNEEGKAAALVQALGNEVRGEVFTELFQWIGLYIVGAMALTVALKQSEAITKKITGA